MAIPGIVAKKGASGADGLAKALTGDIYVRRWQTTVGKGKKKHVVDKELHVNPMALLIGALGAGVAAVGVATAAWAAQIRLAPTTGVTLAYTARLGYINGVIAGSSPITVYKGRIPVARTTWAANGGEGPRPADYYPSGVGWYHEGFTATGTTTGIDYSWQTKNDDKKRLSLEERTGFLT